MKVYHDYENVYIENEDDILELETDNFEKTYEIILRILRNENYLENEHFNGFAMQEVSEMQKILEHYIDYEKKDVKLYSNKHISMSIDYEIICDKSICDYENSIIFLTGLTAQEIVENFGAVKKGNIFIINYDSYSIVTPPMKEGTPCLKCIMNRFYESTFVSDVEKQFFWSYRPVNNNELNIYFLWQLIRDVLSFKHRDVKIFNVYSKIVENQKPLSREGCEICFSNPVHDTSEMNFSNKSDYIKDINGSRVNKVEESLSELRKYVTKLGPIQNVINITDYDFLSIPVYESKMSYGINEIGFNLHGGKGFFSAQSEISALAECMERYNAREFGNEKYVVSTYNELLSSYKNVLDPHTLVLDKFFTQKVKGIIYNNDSEIEWVETIDLYTREKWWVPKNSVFFPYIPKNMKHLFMLSDTTGIASGLTLEESIFQGLLEIIERDSYAIYYRNNMQSDCIEIDGTEYVSDFIKKHLKNNGIDIHLKYLENDLGVHVVHCTLESKEYPIYTHGSGAALDPSIAINRSITEAIQLRTSQIKLLKIDNHKELLEFQAYYSWGIGKKEFVGQLLEQHNDSRIKQQELKDYSTGSFEGDLNIITEKLNTLGYQVLIANLSRKDNDVNTVKVIVPGFQKIDNTNRVVSQRNFTLPKKMGKDTEQNKKWFFS